MDKGVARSDGSHRATALALKEQALGLLDEDDSVPEVGAQLDLAICRLRDALGADGSIQPERSSQALNPGLPEAGT